MSGDLTKTVHVPLSQCTVQELHAKASELRERAETARTDWEMEALDALAERYDAFGDCREVEGLVDMPRPATESSTCSMREPKAPYPPCPDETMGPPFPEAWEMACEHVSKRYVNQKTLRHPAIMSECYTLACMLVAYGLVPVKPASQAPQLTVAEKSRSAQSAGETRHHILVVDDVNDVLVTVGAFLTNAGFPIRKASSGDEALSLIANDHKIDVLVTDFAMPGLSGVELIVQAALIRPNLKSLVITGYPNADGLTELPSSTTILVKPFRRNALVAAIKALLGEIPPIPNETADQVDQELVDRGPV
jgi:CheY-like chemotaxis protein